jgi:two-component sensor histidine kinase
MPEPYSAKMSQLGTRPRPVLCQKKAVVPLAMVLSELFTNAAKHGADSRGYVAISVELLQHSERLNSMCKTTGPDSS